MSEYSLEYLDGHTVDWSRPAMRCTCAYSKKMARTGIPYCSHIQGIIANREDCLERRSVSRACSSLELPIMHDPTRGLCYSRRVTLRWSDERSFEIAMSGAGMGFDEKIIGYGSVDTPRRSIVEMIWPYYIEMHYAKPCSRCQLVVPRGDLLKRDGLHRAVHMAASINYHGTLCADCADLVPTF